MTLKKSIYMLRTRIFPHDYAMIDLLLSICLRFFWLFFVPLHIQFFLKNYKSESLDSEPGILYNIEMELFRCFLF